VLLPSKLTTHHVRFDHVLICQLHAHVICKQEHHAETNICSTGDLCECHLDLVEAVAAIGEVQSKGQKLMIIKLLEQHNCNATYIDIRCNPSPI